MSSYEGILLVASPHLRSSVFARSVVLVLEHDADGSIGVILNHPTGFSAENLWRRFSGNPCPVKGTVSLGGPVGGSVVVLQSKLPHGVAGRTPTSRCSIGGAPHPDVAVRLFAGHARWAPGQLEQEIRQGLWFTQPATASLVFAGGDQLWIEALRQVGRSVLASFLDSERMKANPSVN